MKCLILTFLVLTAVSACSSTTPITSVNLTHFMVGSPIDSATLVKPKVTSFEDGRKVYETKSYIAPISEPDTCFPSSDGFDNCTPSFGIPGSETTTRYYVDPKGIVTEVYVFSIPIAAGGSRSRSTADDIKDEERYPKPELTAEQKKSIEDFYKNVHKQ